MRDCPVPVLWLHKESSQSGRGGRDPGTPPLLSEQMLREEAAEVAVTEKALTLKNRLPTLSPNLAGLPHPSFFLLMPFSNIHSVCCS